MADQISDGWYTGAVADDVLRSIDEANDRAWCYAYEEETAEAARERMSPDELAADLAYEEQRCEACGAAWKGCGC